MKNIGDIEIYNKDRFRCVVKNIFYFENYKGITVEEPLSKGNIYFGKVSLDNNISINDILYIGAEKLNTFENKNSMKVTLYDKDQNLLDWTLIY